MKNIEIVATIANEYLFDKEYSGISGLIRNGVNKFRINLSKIKDKSNFDNMMDVLMEIREKFGDSIFVMLDLPLPLKKIRCYNTSGKDFIFLRENDVFSLTSSLKALETLFYVDLDKERISNILEIGQSITYSDGEYEFIVKNIDKERDIVFLAALSDCQVFSGKSINIGRLKENYKNEEYLLESIKPIKPDCICLSFVENPNYVQHIYEALEKYELKCSVISKIETIRGVENINSLAEISDIMIARGDLSLNVQQELFLKKKKKISRVTKENNSKLYVATNILSSLAKSSTASASEIVDLSFILSLNPDAIIFNFGVVRSRNFPKAIETIKKFECSNISPLPNI